MIPKLKIDELRRRFVPGDKAAAESILATILSNPASFPTTEPSVLLLMGSCYRTLGDFEQSLNVHRRAFEISKRDLYRGAMASAQLHIKDEFEQGKRTLEEMVERGSKYASAYVSLANYSVSQKDFDNALRVIGYAFAVPELQAKQPGFLVMAAHVYFLAKEFPDSKSILLEAFELLFNRSFASLSEVPLPGGKDLILGQWFWMPESQNSQEFAQVVEEWIRGITPERKMRNQQLLKARDRYNSRLKAEVDSVCHSEETMRGDLETFEETAPYRGQANSIGL